MEEVELIVSNVTAANTYVTIKGVDFSLKSGDVLGIVGRSGAGKSTVLLNIIGLQKRKTGTITVYKSGKKASLSQVIGYSPQDNALYEHLTLKENIELLGRLYHVTPLMLSSYTSELLEQLKLTGHENKKINEFSGGMKKRADLACALIHDPRIIVLDEPFTGLDVSLRKFIWSFLLKKSSQGAIIILTTHALSDMKAYCNKYGLVERGVYYSTKQIKSSLAKSGNMSIESFLERRFKGDIQ